MGVNFVELEDGRRIRSDLTIWAGSFTVSALARESALAVAAAGSLLVKETPQSQEHPTIIGAGDFVSVQSDVGKHLRIGGAVAAPMGGHAALSIGFCIRCLSLGRRSGFIRLVGEDDVPGASCSPAVRERGSKAISASGSFQESRSNALHQIHTGRFLRLVSGRASAETGVWRLSENEKGPVTDRIPGQRAFMCSGSGN